MERDQTVSLPSSIIEEAKAITGKRTPRAAFKALVALEHVPRALREPEREFRKGRGKSFSSAHKALSWLES